jgi:hypothetical protein
VFADAPSFALSDLPVIEVPSIPAIGQELVPRATLRFITEAWSGLKSLGMKPVRAVITEDDLHISLSGSSVLLSMRLPLSDSLEILRSAARQDPSAAVIDVRFPGKVILREGDAARGGE